MGRILSKLFMRFCFQEFDNLRIFVILNSYFLLEIHYFIKVFEQVHRNILMIWGYRNILSSIIVKLKVFRVLCLLLNLFFFNNRFTWDFLKEAVSTILLIDLWSGRYHIF